MISFPKELILKTRKKMAMSHIMVHLKNKYNFMPKRKFQNELATLTDVFSILV